MGLEQDITIAFRLNNDGILRMANVDFSKYPDQTCSIKEFTIDGHKYIFIFFVSWM